MVDQRTDSELYDYNNTFQTALASRKEIPDGYDAEFSTFGDGYGAGFIAGMKHMKTGRLISGSEIITLKTKAFMVWLTDKPVPAKPKKVNLLAKWLRWMQEPEISDV